MNRDLVQTDIAFNINVSRPDNQQSRDKPHQVEVAKSKGKFATKVEVALPWEQHTQHPTIPVLVQHCQISCRYQLQSLTTR